jgi:hypothetical protein
MGWRSAAVAASLMLAAGSQALAGTSNEVVAGSANPNLAGQPGGTLCCGPDSAPGQSPLLVSLTVTGGDIFTFSAVGATDGAGSGVTGPDGNGFFNMTNYGLGVAPANGVNVLGLVGVFLSAAVPTGGSQPASLSFPNLSFAALSPGLGQIFWIGDGLTGTGAGSVQSFTAPTGATRLFLGTVDGVEWANNTGSYRVTVNSVPGGVPEPSTWALLLLGLGGSGAIVRRRRMAMVA